MRKLRDWFIGDYLAKTDDVFVKAKIRLTYDYCLFFFLLGVTFYVNLIANSLWYHFSIITFACFSLILIPFILKYRQNLTMAANWYVIQQTITSWVSVVLQEFKPDMSGALWTISFILYIIFIFGVKRGLVRILPFLALFITILIMSILEITPDFGIPDSQQLPNQPFVTLVPFCLCLYLVIVFVRTNSAAEKQISDQKRWMEQKNKDITDSINYSKKIQFAVLPHEETIQRSIPLFFILYKPKDIVSGDFYWFYEINSDEYIIICADCTGHGVPGAFMTVMCSTILNQVVVENKIHQPAEILREVDAILAFTLKQESKKEERVRDGMDLSLLKVNKIKKEATIAGAKRPVFILKKGELNDARTSKFSIGGLVESQKEFTEQKLNFEQEDMIFLYTDGMTDQFWGKDNKKFMTRRLREMISLNWKKSLPEQHRNYDREMENWKGTNEQTDDMLMIGIKF